MPYTTSQAFIDVAIIYAIVIVVSLLVAVVIRVIVWTLSRRASQAEIAAARIQDAKRPSPLDDQVPAAHLAAIAAAVTMMSGAHRIVRIESAPPSYGWAIAGRSAHHHSHITRRS